MRQLADSECGDLVPIDGGLQAFVPAPLPRELNLSPPLVSLLDRASRAVSRLDGVGETVQKAVLTRAKKSIANFKLRAGMAVGAKVTLRRTRMYEFVDRLLNIALPRVRDFRGVSPSSFDGHGNYTLGLKEQIVFPEIDYDRVSQIRGLDIVICTTAKTNEEARVLLGEVQIPFTES